MAAKEIHLLVIFQGDGKFKIEPFEGENKRKRILVPYIKQDSRGEVKVHLHIADDNLSGRLPEHDQIKKV